MSNNLSALSKPPSVPFKNVYNDQIISLKFKPAFQRPEKKKESEKKGKKEKNSYMQQLTMFSAS